MGNGRAILISNRVQFGIRVVLIIQLLIFVGKVRAQNIPQINYTIKDGLPSNTVYAIEQDDLGFIWVGTSAGLSRYDGYEFKNFTLEDGLPDVEILKFYKDSAGRIWMYSLNGKVGYIHHNKIFSSRNNPELKGLDMGYRIGDIREKGKKLFLSSANSELRVYDLEKLSVDSIFYQGRYSEMLCGCNDELIWFHEQPLDTTSDEYLKSQGKFDSYQIRRVWHNHYKDFFKGGVSYFSCIGESVVTFGTILNYLTQIKVLNLKAGSSNIYDMPLTGNDRILNITPGSNAHLNIYSTLGMYEYDPEARQLNKLNDVPNSSSSIYDQNKNLWISSTSNGLYFQPSQLITPVNDSIQFASVLKVHNDQLLFLHDGQYLSRMDESFETEVMLKFPRKLTFKDIAIKGNEMIVGAYEGLFFIDLDRLKITHETQLSITNINNKKETTTYTTTRLLLPQYDGSVQLQSGVELNTRANDMLQLGDSILLATDDGLRYYFDESIKRFLPDSILQSRITHLTAAHGRIWISTGGHGLVTWSIATKTLENFITKDGLSSTIVNMTTPVEDGMWVSTNQGLNRITLEGEVTKIEALDSYNILTGREVKDLIEYKDHIFLAMDDGLFYFPSNYEYDTASDYRIYIDQVITDQGLVSDSSYLSHKVEAINVTYKLLIFQNKEGVRYQYRLNKNGSTNKDWTPSSTIQVNYQGLGPGSYHFEVRARTQNSLWSQPESFYFTISAAYWETTWFKVISSLLIIASVFLIFYFYNKSSNQKKKLEKDRVVAEITALKAQINPHFLFNALNSIQSFLLSNEQELAEEYLTKYSKLMRRILEQSSMLTIPIHEELETIQLYVDLEKYRSRNRFEFEVEIDGKVDEEEKIPSLIFQPFIENSIWHGVSTVDHGKIKLKISKPTPDSISIEISDNGRGFDTSQSKKSSKGSSLVRGRLSLLNQLEGIKSNLSVRSELDKGTVVSILVTGKLN